MRDMRADRSSDTGDGKDLVVPFVWRAERTAVGGQRRQRGTHTESEAVKRPAPPGRVSVLKARANPHGETQLEENWTLEDQMEK